MTQDQRLAEAESQLAYELNERKIRTIESMLYQATADAVLREASPAEYVTPDIIAKETGWGNGRALRVSTIDDYKDGQMRPVYENERDLQEIRGCGRVLSTSDEMAIAVIKNLQGYVVGEGGTYAAKPKLKGQDLELAAEVQKFVDEFVEANDLEDCGETDVLLTSVIDGDCLEALVARGSYAPEVELIGAETIMEPQNFREVEDYIGEVGLNWRFGVASLPGRPQKVQGYFVARQDGDWDYFAADEAVFTKRNAPKQCKRGVSDFYAPYKRITRGAKLFDYSVMGATIQASIAYIKEHLAGTPQTGLEAALDSRLNRTVSAARGDGSVVSVTGMDTLPGRILNVAGTKYHAGPMGSPQGPLYMDVYQAVARRVGSRWQMPEYMISGDACFSEDTEILTRRGWVKLPDFGENESVATHNVETGALEYQTPEKIYASEYAGEMVRIKSASLDVLVTPNHGIIASKHLWQRREWKRVEASELSDLGSQFFLPSASNWRGGVPGSEAAQVPGLGITVPSAVWFKFLGVFIGDGSTSKNRVCVGGISRPRKLAAYEPLMNELGFHHHVDNGGRHHWYIHNQELADYLRETCGAGAVNKHLPTTWQQWCAADLESLFSGLQESDGHTRKSGRVEYSTTSERLADGVQHLCVHLGRRATVSKLPPGQKGIKPVFKVSVFGTSPDHQLRPSSVSTEDYAGMVWCVEVPNGTVYSRRNGTVSVTGNSNANYASTLAAESPFVKAMKGEQGGLAKSRKELLWKAIAMVAKAGRFGCLTAADLYQRVVIEVTYPSVEIRDPAIAEQVFDSQQAAGVLSVKTRASKSGLDYEDELANGAKVKQEDPLAGLMGGQPGFGGQQPQQPFGVNESFDPYALAAKLLWEGYDAPHEARN